MNIVAVQRHGGHAAEPTGQFEAMARGFTQQEEASPPPTQKVELEPSANVVIEQTSAEVSAWVYPLDVVTLWPTQVPVAHHRLAKTPTVK